MGTPFFIPHCINGASTRIINVIISLFGNGLRLSDPLFQHADHPGCQKTCDIHIFHTAERHPFQPTFLKYTDQLFCQSHLPR